MSNNEGQATGPAAFVLRMMLSGEDAVGEALDADQIMIGWANAPGLLNPALTPDQLRDIVRRTYHPTEPNLRKAGTAAGHIWRFIREMKPGDLVVVPHGSEFFVAEVSGPATYDPEKIKRDSAYRRSVRWLNDKKPIPRQIARAALQSRMKIQGTSAKATGLIDEINECIKRSMSGEAPTFQTGLQSRLLHEAMDELRGGFLDSYGFEQLIKEVLLKLGAEESQIIPRKSDKGADLIATFRVAGVFPLRVAVQAKHWQPEPPVGPGVIEQLVAGIEAESADFGMVVTSGTISDEACQSAERYYNEKGIRIELVDGEQLAKIIIEHGI